MLDCASSKAPKEEDFIHHILDNVPLPPEMGEHLAQCEVCQRRLVRYQNLEVSLAARLYRSQCPSATQLNFYCANQLSADEVMPIVEHLEYCPLCANEVKEIRKVLAGFEPVPETGLNGIGEKLRRIIAALVPMRPQLVTRGMEGGNSGPVAVEGSTWPRQYRASDINISLHLSRTSSGDIMLLGLFTNDEIEDDVEELEGAVVELYGAVEQEPGGGSGYSAPLMSTRIDDLGNIAFKAVPVGEYTMIVRLVDSELVIKG
ncbi:MAG: hypothetical protein J2P37_30615, partial [Ktedonobacteraceae bacterium]|nr:hypothetical protein [Ktedonobacteraceae bacterium]